MKTFHLCSLTALLFLSCTKHKDNKVCNDSFVAWKKVTQDSVVLTDVNADGKSISGSSYTPVRSNGTSCYNKADRCMYTLQLKGDGAVDIYRFDTKNKKTDIISGAPSFKMGSGNICFFSSNVGNKLYYSNVDYGSAYDQRKVLEITISGNTYTCHTIEALYDHPVLRVPGVDERTGDIYLEDGTLRYTPGSNSVTALPAGQKLLLMQFNSNDGAFYGFNYVYRANNPLLPTDGVAFIKQIPGTGEMSVVKVFPLSFLDEYSYFTFDPCSNSYILQQGGTSTNIYWINCSNGEITKHIVSSEQYTDLTYIRE
ncbi:MAG: hypothetical protein JWQ38_1254 [Flavipsychrobacter sp.]|nr:hypothetical protein [Flavipsychrobacter sp.]